MAIAATMNDRFMGYLCCTALEGKLQAVYGQGLWPSVPENK